MENETAHAVITRDEKGNIKQVAGLCKNVILKYASSNPVKFQKKFGHLDLSVVEDEYQVFSDVADLEKFIAFKKAQNAPKEVEKAPEPTVQEAPTAPVVEGGDNSANVSAEQPEQKEVVA